MDSESRTVRTACPQHCGGGFCGVLAHVQGTTVVKLEPASFPDADLARICLRGLASTRLIYHPDRLQHPLQRVGERGEGRWRRISWDEALETVAEGFLRVAEKHGQHAVAWALGGPGSGTVKLGAYLRLAALTGGTRVSAFGYGDAAGPTASYATFGTLLAGPFTAGLVDPELIIFWGTNPGEASPFLMRDLSRAKERGARAVVIDPMFTVTAAKADQYVPIRPGTDAALALAMMNVIVKLGLHDQTFIRRHTVGPFLVRADNGLFLRERDVQPFAANRYVVWDEVANRIDADPSAVLRGALTGRYEVNGIACRPAFSLLAELAEQYPPARAAEITNVPANLIEQLAIAYAQARSGCIHHHMGLQRTFYGDLSVRAVCTLAAIAGHVNLPGGPGHRQVVLNWDAFLRPGPPGYRRIGILQMYDAITRGEPYPIKAAYFAFINFINQCANSERIRRDLFGNLEFIVAADMFMTENAQYADVVLPVCTYLEHSDLVNGPSPYLQLQQRVVEPLFESRSDVWIASELGKRLGFSAYFDKSEEEFIDLLLASGDPSVEGISVPTLREGPQRAHGRLVPVEQAKFRTPSGKIEFYVERLLPYGQELPVYNEPMESGRQPRANRYPLVYVQGHSRFRTHSMYANVDWMLHINPQPEVELNPLDAAARGIEDGDTVEVFNDRGRTRLRAKLTEKVQPGIVNITEGWWSSQFAKGGVNALSHEMINPAQAAIFEPNMAFNDVLVEVCRVGEE